MRRNIYRHIRSERYFNEQLNNVYVLVIIALFFMAFYAEFENWFLNLNFLLFCIIWLLIFLRNIRDNYIMDKLSSQMGQKIGIMQGYNPISLIKSPIRLKLKEKSKNDFLHDNTQMFNYSYKLFLSTKYEFEYKKYSSIFNNAQQKFPDSYEEILKLPIYFPIIENYFSSHAIEAMIGSKKMNLGNFTEDHIKLTDQHIIILKDEIFWSNSWSSGWNDQYHKPSIYLAQIENKWYDKELGLTKNVFDQNGKYVLITSNELFLFDIILDKIKEKNR